MGGDDHLTKLGRFVSDQFDHAFQVYFIHRSQHIIEDDERVIGLEVLRKSKKNANAQCVKMGFTVVSLGRKVDDILELRIELQGADGIRFQEEPHPTDRLVGMEFRVEGLDLGRDAGQNPFDIVLPLLHHDLEGCSEIIKELLLKIP